MSQKLKKFFYSQMMKFLRPNMEHLLCLVFFSLIGIVVMTVLLYEEGFYDNSRRVEDAYESVIDGFVRDEAQFRKEREPLFPEFPDPDSVNVLQRHRDKLSENSQKEPDQVPKKNKNLKRRRRNRKTTDSLSPKRPQRNFQRHENSMVNGKLKGGEAQCKIYDTKPEIEGDFECIRIVFKPPAQVCLFSDGMDAHVSHHLRTAGIWEPHILRFFQNILYQDPELGVYDIGAHVGLYSLTAATMGRKVVAVEPHGPSLKRLHKAIKLGNLEDKIIVVQNAISDRRDTFELAVPSDNQGGASLTSQDADRFCLEPECPPHATTILMDDLLEVTNFEKAIIKIDIEGHEHRAFVGSKKLFETVEVQYIFMEWMKLREYHGSEVDDSPDKRLVFDLVDYLVELGYTPRGVLLFDRLDPKYWYGWPDDIVWEADSSKSPVRRSSTKATSKIVQSLDKKVSFVDGLKEKLEEKYNSVLKNETAFQAVRSERTFSVTAHSIPNKAV